MSLFKENSYFVTSEVVPGVVTETVPSFTKKRNNETGKILNKMNRSKARDDGHRAFHGVFRNSEKTPIGFSCRCGHCHLIVEELPVWSIPVPRDTMIRIKNKELGFEIIDGKIFFFNLVKRE